MELLNSKMVPSYCNRQRQGKSFYPHLVQERDLKINKKPNKEEERYLPNNKGEERCECYKTMTENQKNIKLKSLKKAKKDTIESLNIKILSMVTKLNSSGLSSASCSREKLVKERFKTQYSSSNHFKTECQIGSNQRNTSKNDKLGSPQILFESVKENSDLSLSRYREKSAKKYELLRIRQKYKDSSKKMNKAIFKLNESGQYKKQKESISIIMTYKKNKQNDKKELLLKECQRKPLQEAKNFQNKSFEIINSKHFFSKQQTLSDAFITKEEDESEPPTADFRMNQQSSQLQCLLKNIINQIQIDSMYRKAKKWFHYLPLHTKWSQLSNSLKIMGVTFDKQSLQQIFTLNEDEDDPFYSFRESDYSILQAAQLFVKSQEYWFENMVKKYHRWQLQTAGFCENRLDFAKKGYISLSDFVRFLNIEMNVQYRNRDLFLVYLRLKNNEKLKFQDIIEVICL